MSRCPGRHAKINTKYEGRHSKPGQPGAAALIGTAAKAVPVSLVAGAAGSALVLSGTASAATITTAANNGTHDLASLKPVAITAAFTKGRHHSPKSDYTVAHGDTLSRISKRFCGTEADYPSLAAASGISNADVIVVGQKIKLACHHAVPKAAPAPAAPRHSSASSTPAQPAPPAQETSAGGPTGGSAFEACVISRESGGNPQAYNPASGAGGLFQFLPSTWASLGFAGEYPGGAQTAPVSVQEAAFNKLYAEAGTSPWAPYDGC